MNKFKISLLIVCSFIFFMTFVSLAAHAAHKDASGDPTIYKVSIATFEISSDGGNSYITLFNGTSDYMDIASVNAGQAAGNFFSGLSVPDGTYTHVRVTPSATFKMKGTVSHGGTPYYTKADGSASTTAGDLVEATITVPGGVTATTNALSPAITVKNGAADHKVRVSFSVANTLDLWDGNDDTTPDTFYPSVPTVTMTVQ